MVKWSKFTGGALAWDQALAELSFFSLYQSYEWGEVKEQDGWQVERLWGASDKPSHYTMAQILVKRLPLGGVFLWCPGGIMGTEATFDFSQLRKLLGYTFFYCRCSFHDPAKQVDDLKQRGWESPSFCLNSNLSMNLSLAPTEEELLSQMSSNWRHNLKRFVKKEVSVEKWLNPEPQVLFDYYQKFESMKGLRQQHSLASIKGVIEKFGEKLVIFRALDASGNLLGLRGYIYSAHRALDWYAISTEAGRSCYASYGLLWTVLRDAREKKVKVYDLSGVDPINNAGVYNFKKGSGAIEVRYPGEFERSSGKVISYAMNKLMKNRFA